VACKAERREIPGFPAYRIDSAGVLWTRNKARQPHESDPWKPLKLIKNPHGYYAVILHNRGATRHAQVHRLVLEAFVGPCPDGHVACHANDVRTDNRLENLRWDTRQANSADAKRNGLLWLGQAVPNARLTPEIVRAIRREHTLGKSFCAIGREYGMCHKQVIRVVRRERWAHVD